MSKRKAETQQDQQIVCKDCSGAFTFTVREQTAFAAKGFQAKVRCGDCTKAKKVCNASTCTRAPSTHDHRGAARSHRARTNTALRVSGAPRREHWRRWRQEDSDADALLQLRQKGPHEPGLREAAGLHRLLRLRIGGPPVAQLPESADSSEPCCGTL